MVKILIESLEVRSGQIVDTFEDRATVVAKGLDESAGKRKDHRWLQGFWSEQLYILISSLWDILHIKQFIYYLPWHMLQKENMQVPSTETEKQVL